MRTLRIFMYTLHIKNHNIYCKLENMYNIYIYVCMYVYIYVYKCIYICVCIYARAVKPPAYRAVLICSHYASI